MSRSSEIAAIRWRLERLQSVMLQQLAEIGDQLVALEGNQAVDETDTNWKDNIEKLVSEEMKK